MTVVEAKQRQSITSRRVGYIVAILVNGAMFGLINVTPGWRAVPFLTSETPQVVGLVNASIVASAVVNAIYLFNDARWLRACGDLVATSIGLVALIRVWQVFPFDYGATSFDWVLLTRIVLVVGIAGSIIAIIVALATLALRAREAASRTT
ncbi:hypothetical protein GCM10009841_35640 [Microlunatus panaciterrae]|uniref:SPW repeat-containing protein n=1 Tax=Microlunatus panaciterrae TaxID=400768 RepID=A0ABS2RI24_9ACTN|nr:hypothetical protein [Microlunatus panaciterrae]MBM7798222.1 hypothetical protein [Microlunatus panaciterrae]